MIKAIIIWFNLSVVFAFNATEYLTRFGFMNETENSALISIENAISRFQEYYRLEVTGELSNETLNLMQKPRCGVVDYPYNFKISDRKWDKTNLKWYFALGSNVEIEVAKKAFETWENVSNLKFSYSFDKPDIVISVGGRRHPFHTYCMGSAYCGFSFDGRGGVLGHAYFPSDTCAEIHIDIMESWYLGLDIPAPKGKSSLLSVLIHEIGHSLGLQHSSQENSVMYAVYRETDTLSEDDIEGIQYLYGQKSVQRPTPQAPPPPPPPPSPTTTTRSNEKSKDLCQISPQRFLITSNHHFYIFYNDLVWVLNLGDKKYRAPVHISTYFPHTLTNVPHIYQRPSGELVVFSGDTIYFLEFPTFTMRPSKKLSSIGLKSSSKINCVINTYSGRTFVLYDDYYYAEIDECSYIAKGHGLITDLLPGVPTKLNHAFRYTNGKLYFFGNNTYYEFDEFSNRFTKAGDVSLELFGVNCPQQSVFQQIKNLLSQLTMYSDM